MTSENHPTHGATKPVAQPPSPPDARKLTPSVCLYLALLSLTYASIAVRSPYITGAAAIVLVLIVLIELRNISPTNRVVSFALLGAGLACGLQSSAPLDVVLEGVYRSQLFLLLFAAIGCLRYPAERSPALHAALHSVSRQSTGHKFASIAILAHLLGSILNLLALTLLLGAQRHEETLIDKRRSLHAMLGGFLSASCWSPYFLAMTIVHIIYPQLDWLSVLPAGLAIAVVLNLANWMVSRRTTQVRLARDRVVWSRSEKLRLVSIIALLVATVIPLVELADLSAPAAIGIVAPLFGIAWTAAIHRSPDHGSAISIRGYFETAARSLPTLRNETLLFLGANVMAIGVASILPSDLLGAWLEMLAPTVQMRILLVTFGMTVAGMMGFHPVVILVLVAQTLSPELLGIRTELMAALLLAMWGITTALSPFSAVNLFVSRGSGVSPWTLAWRWNLGHSLAAAGIVAAMIMLFDAAW